MLGIYSNNNGANNKGAGVRRLMKDLTKDSPIQIHTTIEELKSKLTTKELADIESTETMIPETQRNNTGNHHHPPPLLTDEGLIIPRKPHNPILDNADRQNLHKELLFNQKIGKNVLNQKCELQKAMEKRKDSMAKKELENNISQQAPELKKVIADRAKRLEEAPTTNEDDKGLSKEFLQARANLKRNDSKS